MKDCFTLTGVRHAESIKRAQRGSFEILGKSKADKILLNDNGDDRRLIEHCMQKAAYICNPIIDWSDIDVWHFIKKQNLPYCSLYDEGWTRLGCIGCPLACDEEREREFKRWPGYEKQYIRTFDKMLQESVRGHQIPFLDGQDVFDWWMHRPAFKEKHQEDLKKFKNTIFEEDIQ